MMNNNWLAEEKARAKARLDKLPKHARPIVTNPKLSAHRSPFTSKRKKDKVIIKNGRRRTFNIEFVEVTTSNMPEVARWAGGVVGKEDDDSQFIRIPDPNAINHRQTKAFPGDVVVHHLDTGTYKAFGRKNFNKSYEMTEEIVEHRDAGTGQYVTEGYAEEHPDTTVAEQTEFARQAEGSELPRDAGLS